MTEWDGEERNMEAKIDRILVLLEDENIGLCPRLRKLETTVNGNGKPGLAEEVRKNNRNWAILVGFITIVTPIIYKILN